MVNYHKGDLLKSDCTLIVHGCNCQGSMRSGIAKQIGETWPNVYKDYQLFVSKHTVKDKSLLGQIQLVPTRDPNSSIKIVANAFTQESYGRDNKRYMSYDALDNAMKSLYSQTKKMTFKIGMPKIGAGLGGGEWSIIEAIVSHHFKDIEVNVYEI